MREEEIKASVEYFEILLREQLARQDTMETAAEKKDYSEAAKITVGIVGGDGIGPIIVREAKRVLSTLLKEETEQGKIILKDIEGLTLENRLKLGRSVPDDVLDEIKKCDVLLKGPTTTPKGGSLR